VDDFEAEAATRIGTSIAGRWFIESLLGVGGMAAVYLVRAANGSRGALKLLHPEVNGVAELRKRFLREGSIAKALGDDHGADGFVRVIEMGEAEDGTAFLVMEALEGESLYDRIARLGTMPAADVLSLTEQTLDVLVIAHARGIVHRDLKPENLHVVPPLRVKVIDFGIARVLDPLPGGIAMPDKTATRTGVIMGTAAYMAPEQATGLVNEIDVRTDIFSLGATMFRLLAGRTVHGALSGNQEVIAAATQQAPSIARVAYGIPPDLAAVVDRALAFLKPHRYPDAETMRRDVRALRSGQRPPYIEAIEQGRIAPGAHLAGPPIDPSKTRGPVNPNRPELAMAPPGPTAILGSAQARPAPPAGYAPASVRIDNAPPSGGNAVARTLIDNPHVTATAPDAPPPARTRNDRAMGTGPIVIIVAALALAAGVGVGIGVTTCQADDPEENEIDRPGIKPRPGSSAR
jgi:eukaryotic-like serine/threonine-protein kinase